jgi:hypothetical protein
MWTLVLVSDQTQSENVNFIKICYEKLLFYLFMTTELFIEYFCNIKLCFLWRFDDKMAVIYQEMVCALILFNVYYFTALHHAAWQSHKEVMQPLLSAGASLSLVDEEVVKSSVNLRR